MSTRSASNLLRLRSLYRNHEPLRRYLHLLRERSKSDQLRILDIGCGATTAILGELEGFRVGIDVIPELLPARGVLVARGSAEAIPFRPDCFDLVCCRAVLEHVELPDVLLSEVARVLRPGGAFVAVTPNKWDYISFVASLVPNRWHPILVRRFTGRPEEDVFPTFYRANTRRELKSFAEKSGLTVDKIEMCREHPHYLQFNGLLYALGVLVEQCLQRSVPVLRPWIFCVLRKPA